MDRDCTKSVLSFAKNTNIPNYFKKQSDRATKVGLFNL